MNYFIYKVAMFSNNRFEFAPSDAGPRFRSAAQAERYAARLNQGRNECILR